MKIFQLILMMLGFAMGANAIQPVCQEIQYSCKGANEVYLVWGINNWILADEKIRPEGTYVKDNLMYTPMKFENGVFSTKMNVKPNTMIDYVFWITKGARNKMIDVWDLNKVPQKDYHTLVLNQNVTLIESKQNVIPGEPLTILDFSRGMLVSTVALFLIFICIRKYKGKNIFVNPGALQIILTGGFMLSVALLLIRPSVLGISWDLYFQPLKFLPQLILGGFHDVLYVTILTGIFLGLLFIFRKIKYARYILLYVFIVSGMFSLIAALLNVQVVHMLGKPFNYQWLYYSDFLNSAESKSALVANISTEYIVNIFLICLSVTLATVLLSLLINISINKVRFKKPLATGMTCLMIVYFVFAQKATGKYKWSHEKLANPVTAFVESVNPFAGKPQLFTMEVADSLKFAPSKNNNFHIGTVGSTKKIKNVLIFVMESTPAEYVQLYNNKYMVTPELARYASISALFENVYAHAPSTNNSLVSLLGSVYPWISYNSITKEHPGISIPTLSSELKKNGYRTAFFNSADNRFQRAGEFLAKRGFDNIRDCRGNACDQTKFEAQDVKRNFLNGKDDECTGKELTAWIGNEMEKPFFTVLWTYQTHYPYFFSGNEKKYNTSDPVFNRYLNALNHSDLVLGYVLSELKRMKLFESTLVLVIGDHGEAFGRHEQTTHASKIYEENLHIPCLFVNPAFKGMRYTGIGGLIDVAPTIMNILNLQVPRGWQGKNLFATNKNDRVYFFAPWSDYLFGYREGNMKYIYNATKGTTEIYDLQNDLHEVNNLAPLLPQKVELCSHRLAAWVQYHTNFMETVLNLPPKR